VKCGPNNKRGKVFASSVTFAPFNHNILKCARTRSGTAAGSL
jgi:hypothetical protein